MSTWGLWLRWSWRDLRARWAQVVALALVIALGAGTYAALLSTSAWRRQSNDASFALLRTHDLRAALAPGTSAPQGSLLASLRRIPDAALIASARERLIVPTQVEARGGILVPGELVGTGAGPGPGVDTVHIEAGQGIAGRGGAGGQPVVVLDRGFAQSNHLPATGTLRVAGGATVRYTGIGQSPEFLAAAGAASGTPFLSQKIFAVLFSTLPTAQRLAHAPGRVNDLVLTLRPGADAAAVRRELRSALAALRPPVAADLTTRGQIPAHRVLYEDINSDEQLWRVVALLILAGAAFATLNLTSRVVEAQRREIGIGMALGVRAGLLAVRPLLFAAQVALIGVAFGVGVGYLVGIPLRLVFADLVPLPVWRTPFQAGTFAQAAVIGFLLPFAAAAWPVLRAVRVQPVDAIRTGHLTAKGSGLAPLLRWLRLPGRGYHEIPFRNALRTPRRSVLTALGVAAAIATAVTVVGLLDTFRATLNGAESGLLRSAPDRVIVSLDRTYPAGSPVIAAIRALPETGLVQPDAVIGGTVRHGAQAVAVRVTVLPARPAWTPPLTAGSRSGGLVLAGKAARDLRVRVGDAVAFAHPQSAGTGSQTAVARLRVSGITSLPLRAYAFAPPSAARALGVSGAANELAVTPAAGHTAAQVRRALLDVPHVASAQGVQATIDGLRAALNQFTRVLDVTSAAALALVVLIAYNTASIGMDERRREHATMAAFGLPPMTVLGLTMVESVLVGIVGAAAGVALGYGLLSWLVAATIPSVVPDVGITAALSGGTIAAAMLLGVAAVAAAPLLTLRRLLRMDVPSTLRVIE